MGSLNDAKKQYYLNSNSYYYDATTRQAAERFDISIDFNDADVVDKTGIEIKMELRENVDNTAKYEQISGVTFDLLDKNATFTQTISSLTPTPDPSIGYTLTEGLDITFDFDAILKEQVVDGVTIKDTKYYGKNTGVVIELVDKDTSQKIDLTAGDYLEVDGVIQNVENGSIRYNLSDNGIASVSKNMKLHLEQKNALTGNYLIKTYFFASDDGMYYGSEPTATQEIKIYIVSPTFGFKAEIDNKNRIIDSATRRDLNPDVDNEGKLKFELTTSESVPNSYVTVTLYKRNATYSGTTFQDVTYSLQDFADYFKNDLKTTVEESKVSSNENEYIINLGTISSEPTEFLAELEDNLATGEYKMEFKLYVEDRCIETIHKTFVITK